MDPPPDWPPLVVSAQVPLYPPLLLRAHIHGEVRVRVTTDGDHATTIVLESGQQIFLEAAQENIRTWRFEPHPPSTFVAVFKYKLLPDSICFTDAPTVVLHLPTEVEVTSRGFAICEDLSTPTKSGG
jgi:TonB family protein